MTPSTFYLCELVSQYARIMLQKACSNCRSAYGTLKTKALQKKFENYARAESDDDVRMGVTCCCVLGLKKFA